MRLGLLFLLLMALPVHGSDKGRLTGQEGQEKKGWFWYVDPEIEPKKKKKDPENTPVPTPPPSARDILRSQGEKLEEALAVAVLNPTRENVLIYLEQMSKVNDQSLTFANSFKEAIWVSPEYDYSLKQRPVTTQAILAYNEEKFKDTESRLSRIADTKGLLFYFRSDCSHCHRFAPVLKLFAGKYGFTVIPVSLDGEGMKEFPNPKRDNSLAKRLEVSAVPALFLVDPSRNKTEPASYGYSHFTELSDKVIAAANRMDRS